jgi:hypothetical protein
METMASVRNAFTDRSNALLCVQNLSAELFFLHTRAGKLESVSSRGMDQERSRHQKIEELKETIRATEDAKSHALKELEVIKVICPKRKVKHCTLCGSFTYDNVSVNIDLFS